MGILRIRNWLLSITLVIFDIVAVYGVFWLATIIRSLLAVYINRPPVSWGESAPLANFGVVFILGAFYFLDLYPGYGLTSVKELERMGKAIILAYFLLASMSYLNKPFQGFPRSILVLSWGLSIWVLPVLHFVFRNILSRTKWYGLPIVVFGESSWGNEVADSLQRVRRLGWLPQAVLPLEIMESAQQNDYRSMIAILASSEDVVVERYARQFSQKFRKIIIVRKIDKFGSLWVEPRDLDGLLGLEFNYHLLIRSNRWIKRVIDIVLSALLLLFLSPLLLFLALIIRIDSPGPFLFKQERLGQGFQRFMVYKFRTMEVGAEDKLTRLLAENVELKERYEKFHKIEKDPRVTKLGGFLRKYSIDELPQLWNVLVGEMSLVGPRAYMPSELDDMGTYASIILRVKPGMTGWWQVLGRHTTMFKDRLKKDEYYISNWSMWMDYFIIIKTFIVILSGNGR